MHSAIVAIGQKMPPWCVAACEEYLKRLQRFLPCQLIEIKSKYACKKEEGELILKRISPQDTVIALAVQGESWATLDLSQQLRQWQQAGKNIKFMIGGADGLSEDCLNRAQLHWSLSALTFPHAIARLLVLEQLYRAGSLLANHPYHRE